MEGVLGEGRLGWENEARWEGRWRRESREVQRYLGIINVKGERLS